MKRIRKIKKSKKNILLIGLGRFGLSMLKELVMMSDNIIACDLDKTRVALASQLIEQCYICDTTNMNALKELDVTSVDTAVIAIGNNLEATIITTINLKELGVKEIIVRIDDPNYYGVLERLGADTIIVPEDDAGRTCARRVVATSILDYYEVDHNYGIAKVLVGPTFKQTSLMDLNLRNKFDINIVGIIRDKKFFIPKATDMIIPNDILLVCGTSFKIHKVSTYLN